MRTLVQPIDTHRARHGAGRHTEWQGGIDERGLPQDPCRGGRPIPGRRLQRTNALNQSGIVRSDIRSSFGAASGVANGVPLTINLAIMDTSKSCAAMTGAAVY